MFSKDKHYWIKYQTNQGEFTMRGLVVEENNFFIKVLNDRNEEKIIPQKHINNIWEDTNTTQQPQNQNTYVNQQQGGMY